MLTLPNAVYFLLLFCAGSTLARNGCRQCLGVQTIVFQDKVNYDVAVGILAKTIDDCATGNQYHIDGYANDELNCGLAGGRLMCKVWRLNITVWRYCGNGGSVNRNLANETFNGTYCIKNSLVLTCDKSVNCANKCYANDCSN